MNLSAPIFTLKRQARQKARAQGIALHQALDALARAEGFRNWSHLAATDAAMGRGAKILARLDPGSLVLLGARPGQGKTLLALELACAAAQSGRPATVFSLEYTTAQARAMIRDQGGNPELITINTADTISAAHILAALGPDKRNRFVVVDYLQLLDQRRETAPLSAQVADLRRFADATGATILCLSQIDRQFDDTNKPVPCLEDVRMPNPLDLTLFDAALFINDSQIKLKAVA